MQRKVLGRGLEALISDTTVGMATTGAETGPTVGTRQLPVAEIEPNPFQPRTRFNDEAIRELAASIKATGVLQPILVRRKVAGGYQLVAGERRLRAASFAGLTEIPAILRDVDDRQMMELALIENVQREDLNPMDEAHAYQSLVERVGLTHDQISDRVGKQRSSITNSLRLLALPAEVREMVSRETLSAGHARALLGLPTPGDMIAAARYVSAKAFSVRRTESFIRRKLRRDHARPRAPKLQGLAEWETKLKQRFSTQVEILPGRKGGRVEFEFYNQEDLERLLEAWGVM